MRERNKDGWDVTQGEIGKLQWTAFSSFCFSETGIGLTKVSNHLNIHSLLDFCMSRQGHLKAPVIFFLHTPQLSRISSGSSQGTGHLLFTHTSTFTNLIRVISRHRSSSFYTHLNFHESHQGHLKAPVIFFLHTPQLSRISSGSSQGTGHLLFTHTSTFTNLKSLNHLRFSSLPYFCDFHQLRFLSSSQLSAIWRKA